MFENGTYLTTNGFNLQVHSHSSYPRVLTSNIFRAIFGGPFTHSNATSCCAPAGTGAVVVASVSAEAWLKPLCNLTIFCLRSLAGGFFVGGEKNLV